MRGQEHASVEPAAPAWLSDQAHAYVEFLAGRPVGRSVDAVSSALAAYAQRYTRESRYGALLELLQGDEVLDVGCDFGAITSVIASRVQRVVGIDIRAEAVEVAERLFRHPHAEYRVGDILDAKLEPASFDCVVFLETIEHVGDPIACLEAIHRVLRPGGVLLLSTPNPLCYHELLRQLIRLWPAWRTDRGIRQLATRVAQETQGSGTEQDHLYSWTWETLFRLLWRSGFAYVDHRRTGFAAPSLLLGSKRLWPLGKEELAWLKPLVGPFCQNIFLKVRAGGHAVA